MGLFIVCPITSNTKNFPTLVKLDSNTMTTGCVLCEHVKILDLKTRKATKKEECPQNILQEVLDRSTRYSSFMYLIIRLDDLSNLF